MEKLESELMEAFRLKDWERASQIIDVARDAERLELAELEVKKRRSEVEGRLEKISEKKEPPAGFTGRKIPLQVTQGARANSYLLVTKALRERALAKDETLTIHVKATGETFTTSIYGRTNILLEKPAIGRFYAAAGVEPGDIVLLEEIAPKEWNLTKTQYRSFAEIALERIRGMMGKYGLAPAESNRLSVGQ